MKSEPPAGAGRIAPHRENDAVRTVQATWLVPPEGASQLRDSAGITPDFAGCRATRDPRGPGERRLAQGSAGREIEDQLDRDRWAVRAVDPTSMNTAIPSQR
jgi:hypothetical protein